MNKDIERAAMTVKEFLDWSRISRTKFYELVQEGAIKVRKVGTRSLISKEDAQTWFDNLETVGGE